METDGTNTTTAVYTNEPTQFGNLISQRRNNQTSYYHFDALGSTRELTDASQTVTDTKRYDAWGVNVASSGTTENPFRFIGERGYYLDPGVNSDYVRRRNYAPRPSRWTSVDPARFADELNDYLYVQAAPTVRTDPSGLECGIVAQRTSSHANSSYPASLIDLGHEWLHYAGDSVGFWPNKGYSVLRPDPVANTAKICWQWPTILRISGHLHWGKGKNKRCSRCAITHWEANVTCNEIEDCIAQAPNPGWHAQPTNQSYAATHNCRVFANWVLSRCCLRKDVLHKKDYQCKDLNNDGEPDVGGKNDKPGVADTN